MNEDEVRGVKEVALEFEAVVVLDGRIAEDAMGSAVEEVADDGMAKGLHVDADLVGAAGLDALLRRT
jgi:hypothetical protein